MPIAKPKVNLHAAGQCDRGLPAPNSRFNLGVWRASLNAANKELPVERIGWPVIYLRRSSGALARNILLNTKLSLSEQ
jgi:hypothetical protein